MEDEIVLFEAPKIIKPEFRLYYDDIGNVLYYTTDKLPGKYIVVDSNTFAESRHDLKVVDGEIVRNVSVCVYDKLVPSDSGTYCHPYDVSIVVYEDESEKKNWSIKTYEYRGYS